MRDYSKIEAWRLEYLNETDAAELVAQGRRTFACLHGLIQAVEKDAGRIARLAATITSLLVLGWVRLGTASISS